MIRRFWKRVSLATGTFLVMWASGCLLVSMANNSMNILVGICLYLSGLIIIGGSPLVFEKMLYKNNDRNFSPGDGDRKRLMHDAMRELDDYLSDKTLADEIESLVRKSKLIISSALSFERGFVFERVSAKSVIILPW